MFLRRLPHEYLRKELKTRIVAIVINDVPPKDVAPTPADTPTSSESSHSSPDLSSASSESVGRAMAIDPEDSTALPWMFAGIGQSEKITDIDQTTATTAPMLHAPQHKLGQLAATAICGNDITSSVLYVAALCTLYAGVYAPIALLIVGLVLYLFRSVYGEVGTALPLNGGAYNVLLNTTSKGKASIAACLTLLSYIATAVISSNEALHYLHAIFPSIPVLIGTVVLLGIFAALTILGITESAAVAVVIFVLHMTTLVLLTATSVFYVYRDGFAILMQNWTTHPSSHGLGKAIFFGFAAAMLGISGFESSANFIEEQKAGVFRKTLRNMWIAVFVFNPLISLLALGILPVGEFRYYEETLLAEMGGRSAGRWLQTWVGVDAFLVLSGAVLTSYVGVTGLVRRMALDRCLPQFLIRENKVRRTPHWIVLSFFVLCCSILFITRGKVSTLAGVYTLSFLGVMMLFAIGNRLLAVKRGRLPRAERASWMAVIIAMFAVAAGILGNVLKRDPHDGSAVGMYQASIFLIYFAITVAAVGLMFSRITVLRALLYIGRTIHEKVRSLNEAVARWTVATMEDINSQAVVFFTRGDGPANLRRAIEYVLDNEHTKNLKIVHVYENEEKIPAKLADQLRTLDEIFPEIRIDFIAVKGKFSPEIIDKLSVRLGVPRNYMFIGCPGDRFPHNLADLGGVRLIV